MVGKWLLSLVVPVVLAGALGACNGSSGAVQPGVVNTSAAGSYRGENGRVIAIREVPVRSGNTGAAKWPCDTRTAPDVSTARLPAPISPSTRTFSKLR